MIVGIDPSLTETGVVVLDDDGLIVEAIGLKSKKLRGMSRLVWIREEVRKRLTHNSPPLVVIEGYSFGSRGRAVFNLGELGGVLRVLMHDLGIEYIEVPPTVLKKFLGKGNFSKEEVMAAISERYGINFENDNVADAYALGRMAHDLGLDGLKSAIVKKEKKKRQKKDPV